MKKIIAAVVFALLLGLGTVHAQLGSQAFPKGQNNLATEAEMQLSETGFSNPGLLPDNPFYFMKRFGEDMRLAFANKTEKAQLHLEFAKTRLAEAVALANKNKIDNLKTAVNEYEQEISRGIGDNVSEMNVTKKSAYVLSLVLQKVPDSAKPAIEQALNKSLQHAGNNTRGHILSKIKSNQNWKEKMGIEKPVLKPLGPPRQVSGDDR